MAISSEQRPLQADRVLAQTAAADAQAALAAAEDAQAAAEAAEAGAAVASVAANIAPKNPLERVRVDKPCIAALYGMSISSFDRAPVQHLDTMLRDHFGAPHYMFYRGGILGGVFDASGGWDKQPYGGVGTIRARGKSTSNVATFNWYGDTYDFAYSREADSEAVSILIDGVSVGNTAGAGAQAYNQHIKGTVALGQHTITINVPAGAGYVYWEYVLCYDSTQPGFIVLDFTVGGTTMANMRTLALPGGTQVAGIPIVGDNGLAACYNRSDFGLIINGHDVNDAGGGAGAAANVADMIDKMSSLTRTAGTPLLHVSSPAGHYARTVDANKPYYDAIRANYRAQAAAWGHVAHFDWHGHTLMPQAKIDDDTYRSTYYLEANPGFIHPENDECYMIGTLALARQLGLNPPSRTGAGGQFIENLRHTPRTPEARVPAATPTRVWHSFETLEINATNGRTWRFAHPHGLAVGDEIVVDHDPNNSGTLHNFSMLRNRNGIGNSWFVRTVDSPTDITVSQTFGGAQDGTGGLGSGPERIYRVLPAQVAMETTPAGFGYSAYIPGFSGQGRGTVRPYYSDLRIPNAAWLYQDTINTSVTSDRYGKYVLPGDTIVQAAAPPGGGVTLLETEPSTLAIRLKPGPLFSIKPHTLSLLIDREGNNLAGITQDGVFLYSVTGADDTAPIVLILHIKGTTPAVPQKFRMQVTAGCRVYGVTWVQGLTPVLNT